ncbi:MAG: hypothetical protein ACRCTL_01795 [Pseudomonas sp.]
MSEAIKVRATAQGFLGKLIEEGEVFTISTEEAFAGSWMEMVDATEKVTPSQVLQFGIKHVGAGNWIAVNNADDSRASRMFRKDDGNARDLAQAEANRLNAGGAILLDAVPQKEDVSNDDVNLPDA